MNKFNDKETLAVLKLAKTMAEIDKAVSIEEYGVLKSLMKDSDQYADKLKEADALDMNEAIYTVSSLNPEQKAQVESLLKEVLSADGIIAESETKLLELIKVICNL